MVLGALTAPRRVRLALVAIARRVVHLAPDPVFAEALRVAEEFAEGRVDAAALREVFEQARQKASEESAPHAHSGDTVDWAGEARRAANHACAWAVDGHYGTAVDPSDQRAIVSACHAALFAEVARAGPADAAPFTAFRDAETARQAEAIRDFANDPFRPVVLDSAWRTANVLALARAAYDGRAFDTLPILADALEDAGCDHPDILAHLRSPGPHVRGCWALDAVLGLA